MQRWPLRFYWVCAVVCATGLAVAFWVAATPCAGAEPGQNAAWDMLTAKPEVVQAWQDARFGMFICWDRSA